MIKKIYSDIDVVKMARVRIKNIFDTANKVLLSVSGGKDSICLNDLIFKMCQSGEINKNKLVVSFVDEEAIYPCIEKIVKNMRLQWLSIGVKFEWWCIQVKHFNCLNQLSQDETFICWDETKKDVWVRKRPSFAITQDPLLNERKDTYQQFMVRKYKGYVSLIGVRVSESVQRFYNIATSKSQSRLFPIYDWTDSDVWNYIKNENLDFPDAYKFLYQVGTPLNQMRISQFFSIDTARSLVKMCEFYPNLFNQICKREPNAYLALLYFDTEMFRRDKEKKKNKIVDDTDYKEKLIKLMSEEWRFETPIQNQIRKKIKKILLKYSPVIRNQEYKILCEVIIAGDPKGRTLRAVEISILSKM